MRTERPTNLWILAGLLVLLSLALATPVAAQEATPEPNDTFCVSCHELQYYLYDSGKYYCLCETPMHCVYCHGGQVDSTVAEIAHEGMTLYPTANNAARCQECHQEDTMAHVIKFDAKAGIGPAPRPVITATPGPLAFIEEVAPPLEPFLHLSTLPAWRLAGLGLLVLFLLIVGIFGYRCYKLDCLDRRHIA